MPGMPTEATGHTGSLHGGTAMKYRQGFRMIPNPLYEELMSYDFTRSGSKVTLAVIHHTLGYQKDTARISLSTFQKDTRLSRPAVKTALRDLISRNVIAQVQQGTTNQQAAIYSFNKNYWEWTEKPHLPSTRKAYLPSGGDIEIAKTYPVHPENLPSTGQVLTSEIVTKRKKENFKKNPAGATEATKSDDDISSPKGGFAPWPLGLPPMKGEDPLHPFMKEETIEPPVIVTPAVANSEKDMSNKERILLFLESKGPATITEIAHGVDLSGPTINYTLRYTDKRGKFFKKLGKDTWDIRRDGGKVTTPAPRVPSDLHEWLDIKRQPDSITKGKYVYSIVEGEDTPPFVQEAIATGILKRDGIRYTGKGKKVNCYVYMGTL